MSTAPVSRTRLAVVTGGNQGIGKEIVRGLASAGVRVVLGARDLTKGKEAAEEVIRGGLPAGAAVIPRQLDVTDPASVAKFVAEVAGDAGEGGGLDILINNAGLAFKGDVFGAAEARATMAVNFYGTIAVTEALLPLLRAAHRARIVNVCSQAGRLSQVSAELQAQFQNPDATTASLSALVQSFIRDVDNGTYAAHGWPRSMYGVSKLAEIAWTYVLARQVAKDGIVVNACCPGYCATAMSSFRGDRSPTQGAETPVWLALRETRDDVPVTVDTAGLWHDKRLISW